MYESHHADLRQVTWQNVFRRASENSTDTTSCILQPSDLNTEQTPLGNYRIV